MPIRLCSLLLTAAALAGQSASTNLITTFAGVDPSFAGGVDPLSVPLPPGPWGKPAVDSAGNIYFSLTGQHIVLRLTPAGRLERFAGTGFARFAGDGGRALSASLNNPRDIAVDSRGNVYIADSGNKRVRRVQPTGIIDTLAGGGRLMPATAGTPAADAALALPWAIAIDSSDNLYFTVDEFSLARMDAGSSQLRLFAGIPGTAGVPQSGPISSARFRFISALAADRGGNLYLTDAQAISVSRVTPAGRLEVLTTRSATFGAPVDVTVDAAGTVFFAQAGSPVIWRLAAANTVDIFAGDVAREGYTASGTARDKALFGEELRLATDGRGNLFVCDRRNGRLRRVSSVVDTLAGANLGFTGEAGPATAASFYAPAYLAQSRAGTYYFSDIASRLVFSIDSKGVLRRFAGNGGLHGAFADGAPALESAFGVPFGIAVDTAGNVYVADDDCAIRRFGADGAARLHAGVPGLCGNVSDGATLKDARFGRLRGLAFDASGNLLVTDISNHKVWRLGVDGVVRTFAGTGSAGTTTTTLPAVQAALNTPLAVVTSADGTVFIADSANNRVVRVGSEGRLTTVAGVGQRASTGDNGPAASAAVNQPAGLALDSAGNLYVAELGANRVRRISASGTITAYAGAGTAGFRGDGGFAVSALLAAPGGLLLNSAGELLIADRDNGRIRLVLNGAPAVRISVAPLTVSPASGQLTGGGTIAVPAPITGIDFETSVRNAPWLRVSPVRGKLPAVLTYETNSAGLAAGEYTGQIVVTVPAATPREAAIPITLRVPAPPSRPLLLGGNSRIVLSALRGSSAQQNIPISNPGASPLVVRATVTRGAYLSVIPAEHTIQPGQTAAFTLTAASGDLAAGTYPAAATFATGATSVVVNVAFNVSAARSRIALSQTGLSFQAVSGGALPLAQSFYASPAERLSTSATTVSGTPWLSASLTGVQITVTANPKDLPPGDHYGRVAVFDTAAPAIRQFVSVLLQVLPAGSDPGPAISTPALFFTVTAGGEVGAQEVELTTASSRQATFSATAATQDGAAWLDVSPSGGALSSSAPARVTVQPDTAGLAPGIYRGAVTLQFDDGQARTVSILLIVNTTASTSAKSGHREASSCSNTGLFPQVLSPAANFRISVGEPVRLAARVVDGCGNLHQPESGGSAGVAVTGAGTQVVNLTHIGGGVWEGTVTPGAVQAATTFTFLGLFSRGTFLQAGAEKVNGAIVAAQRPVVFNDSLTDAASFQFGVPVAPGTLVSLFGANLNAANALPSALPLPSRLDDVEVRLNDQPIPLLFAGPAQVNAQIPYALEPDVEYQLEIRRGTAIVTPQPVVIAQSRPGVFTVDQSGQGQGHIYRALPDGSQRLADASGAATAGEVLIIYCNGLGLTNPPATAGAGAPFSPLAITANPVTVTIGDRDATVLFAGLAPGFAGLYQINAQVPAGIAAGAAVPVVLTVAGQTSIPVTIGVR
ncbi:MAG: hypothetical protein JNM66_26700 [Bryobacterales bacterium]|nr:hypothetical protein [Bryobacterales bacterium]